MPSRPDIWCYDSAGFALRPGTRVVAIEPDHPLCSELLFLTARDPVTGRFAARPVNDPLADPVWMLESDLVVVP